MGYKLKMMWVSRLSPDYQTFEFFLLRTHVVNELEVYLGSIAETKLEGEKCWNQHEDPNQNSVPLN